MRVINLRIVNHDNSTLIFLHGSTELPYSLTHPLISMFLEYEVNLISLELPGHGNSPLSKPISAQELVQTFLANIKTQLKSWNNVILIGYSLGGMLSLKIIEYQIIPIISAITIGSGLVISSSQASLISMYFSKSFFDSQGKTMSMQRIHHNWDDLISSTHSWYYPSSPIIPSIDELKDKFTPILMIFGENDEAFPANPNKEISHKAENISFISAPKTNHFGFFTKSWFLTKLEIVKFLSLHHPSMFANDLIN